MAAPPTLRIASVGPCVLMLCMIHPASALQAALGARSPFAAGLRVRMEVDDASLSASLVARIAGLRPEGETKPLGPDDVSALNMGPRDVVQIIFDAFKGAADHGCYEGCRVLMSFSQKFEDDRPVDTLGQLRPGAFASASAFEDYLRSEPRYQTLALMTEWKVSGAPETRDRGHTAAQKLLVKRDGFNWEQMYCNMELRGSGQDRRWVVMTIYKHDFDRRSLARLTS